MWLKKRRQLKNRICGWAGRLTVVIVLLALFLGMVIPPALRATELKSMVESTNLNDIFNFNPGVNNVGFIYDPPNTNRMHLGDYESFKAGDNIDIAIGGVAVGKKAISLEADWNINIDASIERLSGNCCNQIFFCIGRTAENVNGAGYYRIIGGQAGGRDRLLTYLNSDSLSNDTALTTSDFGGHIPISLSYSAADKKFHYNYNGKTIEFNHTLSDKKMYILVGGVIDNVGDLAALKGKSLEATFLSAKYTNYSPTFLETDLLIQDDNGNWVEPASGTYVPDGTLVTIRAKVKNAYVDGGTVQCHLKPSDDKKHPTAGLDILPDNEQVVTIDGVETANVNISGEGIPFECGPDETIITYRAKINNPDGNAVTVGQMMVDDFFQSKQHSGDQLVNPLELVPEDPKKPGIPGEDYHYTRTPPNANGWNNSEVDIKFYPGTFEKFEITDQKTNTVLDTIEGSGSKSYTAETSGMPVVYQAKNETEHTLSTKDKDTIKIDTEAPKLKVSGNNLDITDNLSGVWKVQKVNTAGKVTEESVKTLDKGNGETSVTIPAKNGIYRIVDAAGNTHTQVVDVTSAPDVSRPDTPDSDPVGPVINPNDPIPESENKKDENGLNHKIIRETIQETITTPPAYGGNFGIEDAKSIIAYRYQVASNATPPTLTETYKILTGGKDITSKGFGTNSPGSCVIEYKMKDSEGNTTTIYLTYIFVSPYDPPVIIRPGSNTPVSPIGPVKTDEKGLKHATVSDTIVETVENPPVCGGRMQKMDILEMLKKRYFFKSQYDKNTALTYSVPEITFDGLTADVIDTSRAGTWKITMTATDAQGNTTTLNITYILKEPKFTAAVPDPGKYTPPGIKKMVSVISRTSQKTGAGPKTLDPFFGGDCFVHLFLFLMFLLTCFYTGARLFQKKHENERGSVEIQ